MHGRVIAVEKLSAQRQRYLGAIARGNLEAAMAAWPMLPDDFDVPQLPGGRLPNNIGLPPYHFRCRTRTVAYFGAVPKLSYGGGLRADARRLIEAVPPEVHAARGEAIRRLAREGKLSWSERQLLADLRKGEVTDAALRVVKHAHRDFGLDPARDMAAYRDLAQEVVRDGEAMIRPHHGRLQYAFGSRRLRTIAIVDYDEMRLFGLYGHGSETGFDKAWEAGYISRGARLIW